jgi:hypothetical protein
MHNVLRRLRHPRAAARRLRRRHGPRRRAVRLSRLHRQRQKAHRRGHAKQVPRVRFRLGQRHGGDRCGAAGRTAAAATPLEEGTAVRHEGARDYHRQAWVLWRSHAGRPRLRQPHARVPSPRSQQQAKIGHHRRRRADGYPVLVGSAQRPLERVANDAARQRRRHASRHCEERRQRRVRWPSRLGLRAPR